MKELIPLLGEHYSGITSGPEVVALDYRSSLGEEAMDVLLKRTWDRDRAAQYTTSGIHKDDLLFTIDGNPLKRFGSQGQQKTYLIALKLAQFELTATRTGSKPVLLLDDIFDKTRSSAHAPLAPPIERTPLRPSAHHRHGRQPIARGDRWAGPRHALLPPRPRRHIP